MAEDNKIIAELIVEGVDQFKAKLAESASGASKFRTEIDKTTDSLKKLEEENKTNTKEYEKLKAKLSELNVEYDKLTKTNVNYKKELKLTKQEIVALTLELNKMKDAGKQGSVEFKVLEGKIKALTDSAGNLHDAISDVSGTVKNAGSDTRGLDRTLRAITSVSAGFQLAQGATALFGSENKELANALIKLNGIMAVTNALQQIQDELLKEDSVLTGVVTKAKQFYTTTMLGATAATRAFYILASGGLLLVLGLIIANWKEVSKWLGITTKSTEELAEASRKAQKVEEDRKELQNAELRYLKAKGVSQKELLKIELAIAEAELRKIQRDIKIAKFSFINPNDPNAPEQRRKDLEKNKQIDKENEKRLLDAQSNILELKNSLKEDKSDNILNKAIKSVGESIEIPINEIKFDLSEQSFTNAIDQVKVLLDIATKEFTSEWSINPKSDSLEPLSARVRDLTKELKILEAQYKEALNPTNINILEGFVEQAQPDYGERDFKPKLTFWERLFGTREQNQIEEQIQQERLKKAQYIVGQLNEIGNGIGDVASKAIAIRANNELSALEEKKKRGLISEKEYEKESAKIKNEAAAKQRKIDIAMALAKVPMVVLQALSSAPPPASFILAGISGALALAQVAILASTPLPKFKDGGLTNRIFKGSGPVVGPSHAQGGVNAELEGSEYVVKGDAVKKYGVKFFDEVNSLKFNPILSMPKQALTHHKKDTKIYEHMATIASYLKQGYKTTGKGNEILKEIQVNLNKPNGY